jgi:hypothetical protein
MNITGLRRDRNKTPFRSLALLSHVDYPLSLAFASFARTELPESPKDTKRQPTTGTCLFVYLAEVEVVEVEGPASLRYTKRPLLSITP